MTPPWATADPAERPDQLSPSGASEIRLLPGFPAGEMAHAAVHPGETGKSAVLSDMAELYFVLAGRGELWRGTGDGGDIVDLVPGRCATIPPGVSFQYRTDRESLGFIVVSSPSWRREAWHESPIAGWPDGAGGEFTGPPPWETVDLRDDPDYLAPDGSEIRLLLNVEGGGLAEARLPPGGTSTPVRHATVEEVWFVIAGQGELWRSLGDDDEVVQLLPHRCATITCGAAFQFRATGTEPLRVLIGTFPPWPGASEATTEWLPDLLHR